MRRRHAVTNFVPLALADSLVGIARLGWTGERPTEISWLHIWLAVS